jgi:hypothetical protein
VGKVRLVLVVLMVEEAEEPVQAVAVADPIFELEVRD